MKEITETIPVFGNLFVILPQKKSSIRVVNGMVERILFREFDGGIRITVLSLDDTHYGNKK